MDTNEALDIIYSGGGDDNHTAAWQHLVDTGLAWKMEGSIGREAARLIEAGVITKPEPDPLPEPNTSVTALVRQPRQGFNMNAYPNIGPYTGVTFDVVRTFEEVGRTFRIVVYAAFNAHGLIGSEDNGILVLDDDNMEVLADSLEKNSSGYFGPSDHQWGVANMLATAMTWLEFASYINSCGRNRYQLSEEGRLM